MVGRLAVTPKEDRTEFKITGTGLLEPLIERALGVPKALVTPGRIRTRDLDLERLIASLMPTWGCGTVATARCH